jgi:hypothetical protein
MRLCIELRKVGGLASGRFGLVGWAVVMLYTRTDVQTGTVGQVSLM